MVCFNCVHCKVCTLYKKYNDPCEHYEERKKKGKWIEKSDNYGHSSYFCSRCGTQEGKAKEICPNCMADMRGDV